LPQKTSWRWRFLDISQVPALSDKP